MERGAEKLELAPPRIMCSCGPDSQHRINLFCGITSKWLYKYLLKYV